MSGTIDLAHPRAAAVLGELRRAARGDLMVFLRSVPAALLAPLRGMSRMDAVNPRLAEAYIPIAPEVGDLLYLTALAIGARRVVEFGTSFGISTLYLGAAMRTTGGTAIGSENEPRKITAARDNVERAGLTPWVEIRAGDARETLADIDGPIDLLLLDGWKDLYLPILHLLKPKLRPGSVVMADNIHTFKRALAPYVAHMRDPANGFESTTLPIGSGVEYSVLGHRA